MERPWDRPLISCCQAGSRDTSGKERLSQPLQDKKAPELRHDGWMNRMYQAAVYHERYRKKTHSTSTPANYLKNKKANKAAYVSFLLSRRRWVFSVGCVDPTGATLLMYAQPYSYISVSLN